jgi:hypothetical protein
MAQLWAGQPRKHGSIPGGEERHLSPSECPDRLWASLIPLFKWCWGLLWGAKQAGHESIAHRHLLPTLTLILLTWRIWWAPNNANKWQMGFNSTFKRLKRNRAVLPPATYLRGMHKDDFIFSYKWGPAAIGGPLAVKHRSRQCLLGDISNWLTGFCSCIDAVSAKCRHRLHESNETWQEVEWQVTGLWARSPKRSRIEESWPIFTEASIFSVYLRTACLTTRSSDIVVSVVSSLWAGRSGVRFQAEVGDCLLKTYKPSLKPTHLPTPWVSGAVSSGVKRPRREVNHSALSSAEARNEWSYFSAPPVCLHGVDKYL